MIDSCLCKSVLEKYDGAKLHLRGGYYENAQYHVGAANFGNGLGVGQVFTPPMRQKTTRGSLPARPLLSNWDLKLMEWRAANYG